MLLELLHTSFVSQATSPTTRQGHRPPRGSYPPVSSAIPRASSNARPCPVARILEPVIRTTFGHSTLAQPSPELLCGSTSARHVGWPSMRRLLRVAHKRVFTAPDLRISQNIRAPHLEIRPTPPPSAACQDGRHGELRAYSQRTHVCELVMGPESPT